MKQKTLVFDVETTPMLAYVWDLHEQNVRLNQIHTDSNIIAWSAKWLGESPSKIRYMDQRNAKDVYNDKKILQPLWKLLDEADIVITQNGKSFDGPRLNARFIMHGMKPPSPYKHLDTYRIVRSVAKFTSNKLEYLTAKLCTKYKKKSHKKFPGLSLWIACLAGNKEAWNVMKDYNIHDVLSTEELYEKIKAWVPQSMPNVHIVEDVSKKCRTCGRVGIMMKRGFFYTKLGSYQRYQCKSCGAWAQGVKEK